MSTSATSGASKLWTPANIVTLVRICCVPLFVVVILSPWPDWLPMWENAAFWKPWVAALVFILISATDAIDGHLARSRNEVTNLGKFMDPLADKILVASALLALIELGVLPSWIAIIILAREFMISGIRMLAASQGTVIAASWYGKAKTVTQIVAIIMFIIKDAEFFNTIASFIRVPFLYLSWLVMIVALALTIISLLDYFSKARHVLGFAEARRGKVCSENQEKPDCQKDGVADEELSLEAVSTLNSELAAKVIASSMRGKVTLATAESLTGGLISACLTAVPGSSAVVRGGIVSYATDVKRNSLGVDEGLLNEQGPVCERVAIQMAQAARSVMSSDFAVAVTGIAGPSGAEPGKPVGTVWVALAGKDGASAQVHLFEGDRDLVRAQTVTAALSALQNALE